MKNMSIAVIAVAVLSVQTVAADISGLWTMRLVTKSGSEAPTISVTLKQDGETLTGSCSLQDLDEILTLSGEAKGDAVSCRCSSREITVTLNGKISGTGREIIGSWSTSAAALGSFTGTKTR